MRPGSIGSPDSATSVLSPPLFSEAGACYQHIEVTLLGQPLAELRPLLDEAAVAAVRRWKFSPTLLNGTPVPIVMTVTVNFKLTQ